MLMFHVWVDESSYLLYKEKFHTAFKPKITFQLENHNKVTNLSSISLNGMRKKVDIILRAN